jgi:sulfatase maturation enzyme AslB (radical SAM superfamily)
LTLLKVIQPSPARPHALFVTTAAEVSFGSGFHDEEYEDGQSFRWMSERGTLTFAPAPGDRYLELWTLSEFHDLSQRLTIAAQQSRREDVESRTDLKVDEYPLVHGWAPLSIVVDAGTDHLELRASRVFPQGFHPSDGRVLALRVRGLRLHQDAERHAFVWRQHANGVLNVQELLDSRTTLQSTPPSLGIDLHGGCNVKPPCVYCEWDYSKDLEGDHVDTPFTRETLEEWGPFFDNAVHLVNCSIGEPFMMRNFDELLDIFGTTGKVLEMTTNGQILTERNIQKLLDRHIDLYVSLDAATPLTYSRLRNDTFDKIVRNLRRLIAAKGGCGRFPHVFLVFMPMRCNVHELDDFVRLCAELQVDRLVLRPLNFSPSTNLDWDRAGYHFSYQDEVLPFDQLVRVSGRAARLARELGVELSDQMDFGGAMRDLFEEEFARGASLDDAGAAASAPSNSAEIEPAAESAIRPSTRAGCPAPWTELSVIPSVSRDEPVEGDNPQSAIGSATPEALPSLGGEQQPACLEPWKSLYILRRGVMPCCYGGAPIAPMEDYRTAWNSPLMQSIRGELLAGRFHDYCLCSTACPIVRKLDKAKALPLRKRVRLKAREWWARIDRRLAGVPNRIWRPLKGAIGRAHPVPHSGSAA